ncbi:hypothetical protein CFC21_078432 [Triticum aestivum]|uniref:Uncharacterized protein n=2 Tax=Triticum aestivum TaxID=4565 RepID=A0A3B6MUR9_WHEAT|nr:hypothetical protein CFC21_078432 [Triticum aestivum]
MASPPPPAFALGSLDAVRLFVQANGRVHFYDAVEITSMRVRDAREALRLLPAPQPEGAARLPPPSPPREDGARLIITNNRARVEHLATAGLMLESTDMILDDLLREVNERRVNQEHVEGLRRNAQFIINSVVLQDPLFFSFVDDVAKEMLGVADKLKPPCRYFAQLHHALQTLKATVNALRDRDVVLSTPSPTSDLPAPGPAVILGIGAPSPAPATGPAVILAIGAASPAPAPATGPAAEPLAVDEEEAPASEKPLAVDEEEAAASEKPLALEKKAAASEKPLALEEKAAASEKPLALEEKAAASEKPLALEEKAAASETPLTLEEKAAASEQPKALALQEKAAASEKQKSLALEEKTAASEKLMAPINADLADPEALDASEATADAFRPGSTDGPAPDAAGVEDDTAA